MVGNQFYQSITDLFDINRISEKVGTLNLPLPAFINWLFNPSKP